MPPNYAHLLGDPNVARWHRNLAKGSLVTSKEYLRTLGIFVGTRGQTPAEFIAMGQRPCEDALHDWGPSGKPLHPLASLSRQDRQSLNSMSKWQADCSAGLRFKGLTVGAVKVCVCD